MRTIHLYGSSFRFLMGNTFEKETARILLKHVLPRAVESVRADLGSSHTEPDLLYRTAVCTVVSELLADRGFAPPKVALSGAGRRQVSLPWVRDSLGRLDPVEVGKLYEYARGFRIDGSGGTRYRIVRCSGAKRSQGLFYTPESIVSHIVSRTLTALEIRQPMDLLDVRLLDPAVGTGLFLAEALDQLTRRILDSRSAGDRRLIGRIGQLKDRAAEVFETSGIIAGVSEEMAVRIHLATMCLYGVDLDPIAVAISRAVLWGKAARDLPLPSKITLRIQIGNSLIGKEGGSPISTSEEDENIRHAKAYFGVRNLTGKDVEAWVAEKGVLHWPHSYPEIFDRDRPGFDAVVGNPPYEIMSVKESGIEERRREQAYFRRTYRTCSGKINTYRLMLERSLTLLRYRGTLGFIVPATLLADVSASRLRSAILDESEILQAAIVPEKARAFKGVTQACVILVARKGAATRTLHTATWDGRGEGPGFGGVEIARTVLNKTDSRIPLLGSSEEKKLLEALLAHPPLRGDGRGAAVGKVHQGEMNMTTHRRLLSATPTSHPLVRGEHIEPFRVVHPSSRPGRWDWVVEDMLDTVDETSRVPGSRSTDRGAAPWSDARIAIGRVVNMATDRRLKAAAVPPGTFLGDMTNYVCEVSVSSRYLLGLLNSRLLNWRIKLTSTNNYLSASEVEALPVPRAVAAHRPVPREVEMREVTARLTADPLSQSLEGSVRLIKAVVPPGEGQDRAAMLIKWIEHLVDRLCGDPGDLSDDKKKAASNLLDALIVELFGVDTLVGVLGVGLNS